MTFLEFEGETISKEEPDRFARGALPEEGEYSPCSWRKRGEVVFGPAEGWLAHEAMMKGIRFKVYHSKVR